MTSKEKVDGTAEAWESGALGNDPKFAKKADIDGKKVDDALGLQMISIRLQKTLIKELKTIAEYKGIGYQPLIKQALKEFSRREMLKILQERDLAAKIESENLRNKETA